jgi:hypothetical protein
MKSRRRGGDYTTNRKKTYQLNKRNCESYKLSKCEEKAFKYDFRGYWNGREVREFFRKNAEDVINIQRLHPNKERQLTYNYVDENGNKKHLVLDEDDLKKEKWFDEIGSRILYRIKDGCYVLRKTPLTLDEVIKIKGNGTKTKNADLYETISELNCIKPEDVDGWYRNGL